VTVLNAAGLNLVDHHRLDGHLRILGTGGSPDEVAVQQVGAAWAFAERLGPESTEHLRDSVRELAGILAGTSPAQVPSACAEGRWPTP
jgi:hypothetical protein